MKQKRATGLFLLLSAVFSLNVAADQAVKLGHSCEEATRRLNSDAWQQCKMLSGIWSTPYLVAPVSCEKHGGLSAGGSVTAKAYYLCLVAPKSACENHELIRTKLAARFYETQDVKEKEAIRVKLAEHNSSPPKSCQTAGAPETASETSATALR